MKKLVCVARDEHGSISHDFVGKFGSAEMLLKKAPEGTGVIAGGPARAVIELAGIKNIRITKVVKGGRNFRFTALVVVGDGNGHVGAGLGKATEIPEAIRKGKEDAMKKLVSVARDENGSITHDFVGKFGSAEMLLKKAPEGTCVIAGGPARAVIELAGIKNIRTKCMGSRNKQNVVLATIAGLSQLKTPEEEQNVVLATIAGLSQLKTPEEVAKLRGKSVDEIFA